MEFDTTSSIGVLDVVTWMAHFVMRYAIFRSDAPPNPEPDTEALHLGVWEAVDEAGDAYTGVGGWAEGEAGDLWTWVGEILFAPGLPIGRTELHVKLPTGHAIDVTLGRGAWQR